MFENFVACVREAYSTDGFIPLHEPMFGERERKYLMDTLDSTFVSSVGEYVDQFERDFSASTGAGNAICTVNGTAALHTALVLVGTQPGDEVLTQPLSFVATTNAIMYTGARPIFIDVDTDTFSLSPDALEYWLREHADINGGVCINRTTGNVIRACVPMHTFGHIGRIDEIVRICKAFEIAVIEDAAEAVGSYRAGVHSGRTGMISAFSFNGNKIITTGGGGMITTEDDDLAVRAKHLTTTAKLQHQWEFAHDELGFNYRLPNLNAALGCAQLEQLKQFLATKRLLHNYYVKTLEPSGFKVMREPDGCRSNHWLNALIMPSREERDRFLEHTNALGIMTRPVWKLLNTLPMNCECGAGSLDNAYRLADVVVNIPSSANPKLSVIDQ